MSDQYPSLAGAKIPFASYDTVVYFGGGAFSLSIACCYVNFTIPIMNEPRSLNEYFFSGVVAVGILFSVYLLGHTIAFLSALSVEGTLNSTYGYPSRSYGHMHVTTLPRQKVLRRRYFENFKSSFYEGAWITAVPRFLFCSPILLFSMLFSALNIFGFAIPKLPTGIQYLVKLNIDELKLSKAYELSERNWFKVIEHYVNCNYPDSARRMYNYLMIYGLLRTGTFLLLCFFWLELNQIIVTRIGFSLFSLPSYFNIYNRPGMIGVLFLQICLTVPTYLCYVKFNRRYFEEAILGFALSKPASTK